MIELKDKEADWDCTEFNKWYAKAKPLEWFTYYYGSYLHEDLAGRLVQKLTWDYAVHGKIYLFCKRDDVYPRNFFFKAQKASRVIPDLNPAPEAMEW